MEAAKAAVSKFTSNRGHHTSVEESVNPAVTSETIKPHRHEEATEAVDREVHQHHYHTTVQPLTHTERLAEKHVHNVLPTEHREFRHDNEDETKHKVHADLGRFKDTSRVEQTHHTQAAAPSVTGEHVHHHVHETVVPVVHKETIQPEVVHTTVPIHETHHAAAQHHGLSALPMKTLDEFKQAGGAITGGKHATQEQYEGQPRQYNQKLSTTFEKLGLAGHGTGSHHQPTDSGVGGIGGVGHEHGHREGGLNERSTHDGTGYGDNSSRHTPGSGFTGNETSGLRDGRSSHAHNSGYNDTPGTGLGSSNTRGHNSGLNDTTSGTGLGSSNTRGHNSGLNDTTSGTRNETTGTKKPSLLDRLNPRKDTDGDGKTGVME